MARLVVVSNRVAVPDRGTGAGGLEVAIRAALKGRGGLWFGWSGRVSDQAPTQVKIVERENITYATIDLQTADHQEFYNGFANRVLWPILHYRVDLIEFTRRDLTGYFRVNELFTRHLDSLLQPDDIIWVHDYHLINLAKDLRMRGHANRIGFFLHVPCPSPEILTALPNHERLLPALAHYDLIGFQTDIDAYNFSRYLATECGLPARGQEGFIADGRLVRLGAFPVGIEAESFARLARRAIETQFVREVLDSLSNRAMIIGVDRLDYSKGLPLRLDAYERFLTNFPDWRGKVTYLQISPKSRTEIPEYADVGRVVGEMAGRINGAFGEASWTPIRYVNKAHSRTALAGLYRAARVGLVTPLRDGMNLVAKEFLAAQDPDDPGVLILSRFAGAARECTEALLVNPYDSEGVGNAINRALSMPLEERRRRHAALFKVLAANDMAHWAQSCIEAIEGAPPAPGFAGHLRSVISR